jgi:hypothetical protein
MRRGSDLFNTDGSDLKFRGKRKSVARRAGRIIEQHLRIVKRGKQLTVLDLARDLGREHRLAIRAAEPDGLFVSNAEMFGVSRRYHQPVRGPQFVVGRPHHHRTRVKVLEYSAGGEQERKIVRDDLFCRPVFDTSQCRRPAIRERLAVQHGRAGMIRVGARPLNARALYTLVRDAIAVRPDGADLVPYILGINGRRLPERPLRA